MNPNMMLIQSWPQTPTRQACPWRHMHFSLKVPWFQDSQRELHASKSQPFQIMSPGHCFPEALPQSHKGTSHAILLEPAQRAVGMSWHCASLSSLLRFSALPLRGNEAKICFCRGPNWHLQTGGRDRNLRIQSSSKTRHIWNQAFLENGHHIDLATLTNCLPLLKIISAAVNGP